MILKVWWKVMVQYQSVALSHKFGGTSAVRPSTMLAISGGQIGNHQFAFWAVYTNAHPTNNTILSKITIWKVSLAQKLFDENVWDWNISEPSVIHFFVHLTSFFIFIKVKFYCSSNSFVPSIEAVLELTTRDSEHCCWFLLSQQWPSEWHVYCMNSVTYAWLI